MPLLIIDDVKHHANRVDHIVALWLHGQALVKGPGVNLDRGLIGILLREKLDRTVGNIKACTVRCADPPVEIDPVPGPGADIKDRPPAGVAPVIKEVAKQDQLHGRIMIERRQLALVSVDGLPIANLAGVHELIKPRLRRVWGVLPVKIGLGKPSENLLPFRKKLSEHGLSWPPEVAVDRGGCGRRKSARRLLGITQSRMIIKTREHDPEIG